MFADNETTRQLRTTSSPFHFMKFEMNPGIPNEREDPMRISLAKVPRPTSFAFSFILRIDCIVTFGLSSNVRGGFSFGTPAPRLRPVNVVPGHEVRGWLGDDGKRDRGKTNVLRIS